MEIKRDDEIDPGHQIAVLLFSESFGGKRDAAVRFMRAYLRAIGYYNGALKDGRLAGPNGEDVINIITEYTSLKDKDILRAMTPTGCDPGGRVNENSLQKDLSFYASQGLIQGDVNLGALIDMSYVEAAAGGKKD